MKKYFLKSIIQGTVSLVPDEAGVINLPDSTGATGTPFNIPMFGASGSGFSQSTLNYTNGYIEVDSETSSESGLKFKKFKPTSGTVSNTEFTFPENTSQLQSLTMTVDNVYYSSNNNFEIVRIQNNEIATFSANSNPNGPLGAMFSDDAFDTIYFLQDGGEFINLTMMSISNNSNQDRIVFDAQLTLDFRQSMLSEAVDYISTPEFLYICSRHDGDNNTTDYTYNPSNSKIWKLDRNTNEITFVAVVEMVYKNNTQSVCIVGDYLFVPAFKGSESSLVKIDRFTGAKTEYIIDRPNYNSPLGTVCADDDGNVYLISLQYNSEILKFNIQSETFTLWFKNYNGFGGSNSLLNNGELNSKFDNNNNQIILCDKTETKIYFVKETTNDTISGDNFYLREYLGQYNNSKYFIESNNKIHVVDPYKLFTSQYNVLSFGVGVDKDGNLVSYVQPAPYIPPSDWDSTSGSTEILNKPTKLSDFIDDYSPQWLKLQGNQRGIGLIDFNDDNKGIYVDVYKIKPKVVGGEYVPGEGDYSDYGFGFIRFVENKFIGASLEYDADLDDYVVKFHSSVDGDNWKPYGTQLVFQDGWNTGFPFYGASDISCFEYYEETQMLLLTNNKFQVFYSSDFGLTWNFSWIDTQSSLSFGFNIIQYVNNTYIVTETSGSRFYYSTNLTSWNYVIMSTISGGYNATFTERPFAYFNGKYYLQSYSIFSGNYPFLMSNDLITWEPYLAFSSMDLTYGSGWLIDGNKLCTTLYSRQPDSTTLYYFASTLDAITWDINLLNDLDDPGNQAIFYSVAPQTYYKVDNYFIIICGPTIPDGYGVMKYLYSTDGINYKSKITKPGVAPSTSKLAGDVGNHRLVVPGNIKLSLAYQSDNLANDTIFSLRLDETIHFVNNVNEFQINGLEVPVIDKTLNLKLQGYLIDNDDVLKVDKYNGGTVSSATYSVDWIEDKHHLILTTNTTITEINNIPEDYCKTINLFVTGNYTLTLPSSWTINSTGSYVGTRLNKITVDYIKSGIYYTEIK